MGSAPTGFDILAQAAPAAAMQQRQIAQQQRLEQQNTVGAQLLDSINNASNIKPTVKDPNTGQDVPNPAYAKAQTDKQALLSQYVQLNSPEQHASFGQRLHGLIFGTPSDGHQQPALSPNSSPVAPTPPPEAPASGPSAAPEPSAPVHPMAPLPAEHPANKITAGLAALKNHLQAAANPNPKPPPPDAATMATYYRDPGEVAAERNQALWGIRGQTAENVANIRKDALVASLNARPPRLLSQTTIPDLLDQMKVDPSMIVVGANGQELSPAQLSELPPGTVAREFRAGSQIFYALGDQNSKTINVGGQIVQIPALGPVTAGNSTPLGAATSTLPKTHTNATTDAFGNTTTSASTTQTATTPGITAPAPPVSSATPTLLRRDNTAAPAAPPASVPPQGPLAAVNAGIQQGNAASKKLNKGKPVSANAPLAPLDADGHIPSGVGNDLVRQYANNLLDGQDMKNIPNPAARAAAEALASRYGWSQGAFTPREKVQFNTATTFLKQLQDSPALSVLDSGVSSYKIGELLDQKTGNLERQILRKSLTPNESEFLKLYNSALATVQGLAGITRSGRATEKSVDRLQTELPNVFQSASSTDAKQRIDQLLKEADLALHTKPSSVGKGGPVSANAPSSPGAPKVGDVKTFPNGRKGVWDGTGYVAQ